MGQMRFAQPAGTDFRQQLLQISFRSLSNCAGTTMKKGGRSRPSKF
jgi:hypothetical protein